LTDDDQPNAKANPEKNALQGNLVGQLKLELVNSGADKYERKPTVKDHLRDITFWISVLTLGAVLWYACEAYEANDLTRTAVAANSRPYLLPLPPGEPSGGMATGDPIRMNVDIFNLGKMPTRAIVKGSVVYSRARLNSGPTNLGEFPPLFIWPVGSPAQAESITVESANKISPDDFKLIKAGNGWVYLKIEADYGDGFVTRICKEFSIRTDAVLLAAPILCADADTNCTDKDCK
jgi:hypothetical protein